MRADVIDYCTVLYCTIHASIRPSALAVKAGGRAVYGSQPSSHLASQDRLNQPCGCAVDYRRRCGYYTFCITPLVLKSKKGRRRAICMCNNCLLCVLGCPIVTHSPNHQMRPFSHDRSSNGRALQGSNGRSWRAILYSTVDARSNLCTFSSVLLAGRDANQAKSWARARAQRSSAMLNLHNPPAQLSVAQATRLLARSLLAAGSLHTLTGTL